MAINSKAKGKKAELEFAKVCKAEGYKARRTQQYAGNTGQAADVVGLPNIHIEVKRVEHLNIYNAIAQAVRDSKAEGKGNIPIVAHRRNHCEWLITMKAEDFFKIYREYEKSIREGETVI